MKNQRNFTDNVIAIIQEAARILWSVAALLAPWLVPVAPAVFFGWTIYQTATNANMPGNYATWAAIAAAVGLETVNIAANHAMLKLSHDYKEHVGKFSLSLLFIVVYVTIGVVSMAMLDVSGGVRIIGIGMFLLAPVAIGAQALTMDLVRVNDENDKYEQDEEDDARKREQVEEDARVWEREQGQRQIELDYQERLARIEANKEVRIERERVKVQQPVPVNVPSTSRQLPDWLPVVPDNLGEFRQLVDDGTVTLTGITGAELAEYIPVVGSDSTGRYWLRQVRNGKELT